MSTFLENAILRVTDQATGPINKIDAALRRLDALAKGFGSKSIDIKGNLAGLTNVQQHLRQIERTIQRINATALNVTGATNAATAAIRAQTVAQTASAAAQSRAIRARERDLAYMQRHALHSVGVPYSAAATGVHYMHLSEKYPVASRAILGSAMAAGAFKHSIHAAADADTLEKQMDFQGWSMPYHEALTRGLDKAIKSGDSAAIDHYKHALHEWGNDNKTTSLDVLKAAEGAVTRKYANVSENEVREIGKDLLSIMGDTPHAMQSLEPTMNFVAAMKAFGIKGDHKEVMREAFSAIKSAEIAGQALTPEALQNHLGMMFSLKAVYGDQAKLSTYLMAQRAAGVAFLGTDDKFKGIFGAYVQEYNSSAGVQLATAFRAVAGNKKYTEKEQAMMARYGLLDGDRMANLPQFLKNPFEYASAVGERIKAQDKIDTSTTAGKEAFQLRMIEVFGRMFGDRNAAKMFTEMVMQQNKLRKDSALVESARERLVQGEIAMMNSVERAVGAVKAQLTNVEKNMLAGTVGPSIKAMDMAASALSNLSTFAKQDPLQAWLMGGMLGVGGLKAAHWAAGQFTGAAQMQAAAGQHMSAAAALQRAAYMLSGGRFGTPGPGGMLTTQQRGQAAGKAAWLGFPSPERQTLWQRIVGASWANKAMLGLGALGVVGELFNGSISGAALNAGMLAAGIWSAPVGMALMAASAIDALFNGGRAQGAIVDAINKLFGVGKAKADELRNPHKEKAEQAINTLQEIERQIAEKRLRLDNNLPGAQTKAERRNVENEIAILELKRATQNAVAVKEATRYGLLAGAMTLGESMMNDPHVDRAIRGRQAQMDKAAADQIENTPAVTVTDSLVAKFTGPQFRKAQNDLLTFAEDLAKASEDMAKRGGASAPSMWNPFNWFISPAYGAGRPTDYSDLNTPTPTDPFGGVAGAAGGAGAGIFDQIAAPLTTAGDMAAQSISQAGTSAGAEIAAGGQAAGGMLANGASEAASAIVAAGHAFAGIVGSISIPGASEIGPRAQNTGANPTLR